MKLLRWKELFLYGKENYDMSNDVLCCHKNEGVSGNNTDGGTALIKINISIIHKNFLSYFSAFLKFYFPSIFFTVG